MSLKEKSISGFIWSFADNLGNQGVQFVIGIVLARLLTPEDYGLVGIVTVFIVISQSFVDSGFTQAIIRKKDASDLDFSTVFYFNFIAGLVIYLIIFSLSQFISDYFEEEQLVELLRVLSLSVIISALASVQRAKLTKEINFKLQTKISIGSNVSSGLIGISLAFMGFGVWSLVWRTLLNNAFQTLFLWIFGNWKPKRQFSKESFKELFNFGYKLLLSGFIDRVYNNIYYFIIGKFFSVEQLGFYSRADQFNNLFSKNLYSTIQRVSYPILSEIQDDNLKLKNGYKKVLRISVFITAITMMGLAAISENLIIVLIGYKWLGAVEYLQLLCFVGLFFPLHALNLNILNIKGRSDIFLFLEIIKKFLASPIILVGIYLGIKEMIIAMIINSIIGYFINSYNSGKLINYSSFEQIKDVVTSLFIGFGVGGSIFILQSTLSFDPIFILISQLVVGSILILIIGELFRPYEYCEIKSIFLAKKKIF